MSKTLQFSIQLMGSNPLIWRTFKVSDSYRLDRFHQVIQIVMGWYNAHLHEFRICLLYTSPSPRDATLSRMPSSA